MKERCNKQLHSSCMKINMQDMKSIWQNEHGNDDDGDNDDEKQVSSPIHLTHNVKK